MGDLENMVLPGVKCYSLNTDTLPSPADLVVSETAACLRSRFSAGSPFAVQYWNVEGKTHHEMVLSTSTDVGRPIDSATVNVMTLLIEASLPCLLPFLRGMREGFLGRGGHVSGDLYVELLTIRSNTRS